MISTCFYYNYKSSSSDSCFGLDQVYNSTQRIIYVVLTINNQFHLYTAILLFILIVVYFTNFFFLDTLGSRKAKLKNAPKKAKRSHNTLDSDEDPIMV